MAKKNEVVDLNEQGEKAVISIQLFQLDLWVHDNTENLRIIKLVDKQLTPIGGL